MSNEKLPNIQVLFNVMQQFAMDTSMAGINKELWNEARQKFRENLDKLGIADKFDWEEN